MLESSGRLSSDEEEEDEEEDEVNTFKNTSPIEQSINGDVKKASF